MTNQKVGAIPTTVPELWFPLARLCTLNTHCFWIEMRVVCLQVVKVTKQRLWYIYHDAVNTRIFHRKQLRGFHSSCLAKRYRLDLFFVVKARERGERWHIFLCISILSYTCVEKNRHVNNMNSWANMQRLWPALKVCECVEHTLFLHNSNVVLHVSLICFYGRGANAC